MDADRGTDDALLANVRPADWPSPVPRNPYALVVIGGGPAGHQAAYTAALFGARVAIVEQRWLGGASLNEASVPTKTFHRTARLYADMKDAELFGARPSSPSPTDFASIMARARRVRTRVSRKYSAAGLKALGVDVYFGQARFAAADAIEVEGEGGGDGLTLRFRKAIVATGSTMKPITIPGLVEAGYLAPSRSFTLDSLPRRLLVIGGGPEACEGAQALSRLGASVVIAMDQPLFLPGEERDAAAMVSDALARDGVAIHLNTHVAQVRVAGDDKLCDLVNDGEVTTIAVDAILVGLGRRPAVDGLDLERAGIAYDADRGIHVDDFLRTANRRVYAAGDVCVQPQFTSTAFASARIATYNALVWRSQRYSKLTIPWCTYTDPEIAHVGMYVRQARERGIAIKTYTVPMHDVDRAIADGEEAGFVKLHVREGNGEILGATIVARHAGEMINEISLAIAAKMKLPKLAEVLRAYPTQAEAIRIAADSFRLQHLPAPLRWRLRRGLDR